MRHRAERPHETPEGEQDMALDAALEPAAPVAATRAGDRPLALLSMGSLVRISLYWLGLTAVDSAVALFVQNRINFGGLVDRSLIGLAIPLVAVAGPVISIVIQPTVGYISDYTTSRWGRRKPYIVVGTVLDMVFLVALASSNSLLAFAVLIALIAVSSNIARGPFQGYVPDLVAAPQVGMASALVGLMQVVGNVTGFALGSLAVILGHPGLGLVAVGVIELVTMAGVVMRVSNGPAPKPREGKSWGRIAREAWATDILQERSYMWLVASRLAFLMGGGILVNWVITYLNLTHGMGAEESNATFILMLGIVVVGNMLAIIPAARLSDRIGRKPLIYASCAIGGTGVLLAALAPVVPVALLGGALFGIGSGMFLAVDWALMTDIIPRASAGRYMGISNVATGASIPLSLVAGGVVIFLAGQLFGEAAGPRAAYLVGLACFVLAAILLRPVVEPDRRRRIEDPGQAA
jgi:MFS family permease